MERCSRAPGLKGRPPHFQRNSLKDSQHDRSKGPRIRGVTTRVDASHPHDFRRTRRVPCDPTELLLGSVSHALDPGVLVELLFQPRNDGDGLGRTGQCEVFEDLAAPKGSLRRGSERT
jgi:hypothetical protein